MTNTAPARSQSAYYFGIDRGGTFTDVIAWAPDGRLITRKVLSEQDGVDEDAAILGIKAVMRLSGDDTISPEAVNFVRMGTTVGTNALLQRNGESVALLVTDGFRDVLRIGYQNRPRLFDLNIRLPQMLYDAVVEVAERVDSRGVTIRPLNEERLRRDLSALRRDGYRSCAISLMHGYRYPEHEKRVAQLARESGFDHVSTSHECSGLIRFVSRTDTAVVDAHLTPVLRGYVDRLQTSLGSVPLLFMQSNGGLVSADRFRGKDCVLSGPAGGVVGAVTVCRAAGFDRMIGFDMGGTSTDVAHYAGEFERSNESEIAGVRLRTPMMAIHTVAAGGGSIVSFDGQRFRVGPRSAGARPGPACYRNGGPLTVTDCNLILGRIIPKYFPSVFGPSGDQPIDTETPKRMFTEIVRQVDEILCEQKSMHECAEGFLQIAVENMANAIKKISVERGYDVTQYTLCSFGGAGGQHACRVAEALNIPRVFFHPWAGVLSAYGIAMADLREIEERTIERSLDCDLYEELDKSFSDLEDTVVARLLAQGVLAHNIATIRRAVLRYQGSNVGLEIIFDRADTAASAFVTAYRVRYGFTNPGKPVVIESIAVEAAGHPEIPTVDEADGTYHGERGEPNEVSSLYVDGSMREVPVFERCKLVRGQIITGPAIVVDTTGTTVIDQSWTAEVVADGALLASRPHVERTVGTVQEKVDPVYLELFNNRFMAIAEQMGQALINTAHSVNIKERLDFSCAIFDHETNLIANAPHIPIHLGAMSESVEVVSREFAGQMQPGDVFVLNSPYRGGAHLPDVTVVAPVFDDEKKNIIFFTAARGHHADVGGITPGSMPSHSSTILEEGVVINPTRLVERGVFLEDDLRALLNSTQYPARNPEQNLADLRAQAAACARGAEELRKLTDEFGLGMTLAYTQHIQDAAEEEVRRVIGGLSDGAFTYEHDLGFRVCVKITVDRATRSAVIDFTGTSDQVPYNFNAPPCITRSAVLYVFRTLIERDIPLNAGCLRPLQIVIPPRTMLRPEYPAAVASGNPETSALVTDTLFGALKIIGGAQGTMNNLTFGNDKLQYYETICGGAGAVDGWAGASAVHTHMTNARMTDPEVFELRLPALIEEFSIRKESRGRGRFDGGEGTTRRLRFLEPMEASIVSNHRRVPPYGARGGMPGGIGHNILLRNDGSRIELGSCERIELDAGDAIEIQTPGGGGFGAPSSE